MSLGLYLHIPFCLQKCLYCDFPSQPQCEEVTHDYVAALCREIAWQGGFFSQERVETIYIGGGTPTILTTEDLVKIINCVYTNFKMESNIEFSIESNPGTVNIEKMTILRQLGVNRISLGVQSFSDAILRQLGRIHTAKEAETALHIIRQAGFENINIDLMYGLPGQSLANFQYSLLKAIASGAEHISAYGLKIEENTPFAQMYEQGKLRLPDEDAEQKMFDLVIQLLPQKGFHRYEISNYAKVGYECQHNFRYWKWMPYLGIGAAGHSFIENERFANTENVSQYIQLVQKGILPIASREKLDARTAMAEFAFLSLRTTAGISYSEFEKRFDCAFNDQYGLLVEKLVDRNLLEKTEQGACLSSLGLKYGNIVFAEFLQE